MNDPSIHARTSGKNHHKNNALLHTGIKISLYTDFEQGISLLNLRAFDNIFFFPKLIVGKCSDWNPAKEEKVLYLPPLCYTGIIHAEKYT